MKNEKYRPFMVTPAFLEARRRKERNEATYGRVLPPSSALDRPKTKPAFLLENKPNSSPPRLKCSMPPDAGEKTDMAFCMKDKSSPGENLKSWTIPKRILSTDCIKTSADLSNEPGAHINGNTNEKIKGQRDIAQRAKPSHSSMSYNSKRHSSMPKISSENRRNSSKSSGKEVNSHDFGKEWLRKFDTEERRVIEGILKKPADKGNESKPFKQTIQLRTGLKSREIFLVEKSDKLGLPATPSYPNILHKTSSVAWRRDSTWLKPVKASYQSWHGLPMHRFSKDIANIPAMYMLPHKKTDPTFIIHPEWGCKV